MTWLELYTFLNEQANSCKNFGKFNWNEKVIVHDAETGDEYGCDTYIVSDKRGDDRFVIITNIDKIFN